MKFFIDMPLSPALAGWLVKEGHEAVHAVNIGLDRSPDGQIIEHARREKQIIVTADLDYPRLLALAGADSPAVILFRGGNYNEAEMLSLLVSVLKSIAESELITSFVVVDQQRIRKRRLPLRQSKE